MQDETRHPNVTPMADLVGANPVHRGEKDRIEKAKGLERTVRPKAESQPPGSPTFFFFDHRDRRFLCDIFEGFLFSQKNIYTLPTVFRVSLSGNALTNSLAASRNDRT